ncbi:FtsX-like permease family protein [Alteromonas sediminis]|uniref:FtsX-like permease family protein n=1 Tax=Alteromonas sediminis TaxID=2259342 RepID=A0A3N5XY79_9ALTE|nr:ABC transporter permease [Alteromonas sediminis]RPJ65872.1 FtsX-like permease family protein [Alteromonas sediminis]
MKRILAWKSLVSRKKTVILTCLSLIVSISVLMTVEHLRAQAKDSFNRTISGTDLIVGAPSGELNLLLYTVFRMGSPTNNIQFDSLDMLNKQKSVSWTIPLSLGDSHKGYRVLGTNQDYFEHFKYGDKRSLSFSEGEHFDDLFDVVIGAEVAKALNYSLGDKLVIAHGIGSTSFQNHDNAPFTVAGILQPTGTPVDKTVHVSLEAIEAIHLAPAQLTRLIEQGRMDLLKPKNITGVLVGLENKFATFSLQRMINNYPDDRLMAVLPGVAMTQMWSLMESVENLLMVISLLVLLASLFGLMTMLLASMNERSVEIAVLRTLGASPLTVLLLIVYEALLITALSVVAAYALVSLALVSLSDWLAQQYGLFLSSNLYSMNVLILVGFIFIAALVAAIVPAIEAYRKALQVQLSA